MRSRTLWLIAAAVLAVGCRRREQVRVDTTEAQDIPREIAVSNLRDRLPTAETIRCTLPSDTMKQSEIREWGVGLEAVQMRLSKGDPLGFKYTDVTRVEMERVGNKYFHVKVHTAQQPDREHFVFTWRTEDTARRVHELLESLRQKK